MTGSVAERAQTGLRFEFAFDSTFRAPLAALGVTPERAWVELDDAQIVVHFGVNRVRTRRTNLAHVCQSGPFHWWRAIGPRLSLADRGATFGTNAEAGVCLTFHSPVGILPGGRLRVPGLTLTVADPIGLERALRDG
ncbi:MAG: hypothetical protein ACT4QF_15840 [Sporichthyaceae bacterium]